MSNTQEQNVIIQCVKTHQEKCAFWHKTESVIYEEHALLLFPPQLLITVIGGTSCCCFCLGLFRSVMFWMKSNYLHVFFCSGSSQVSIRLSLIFRKVDKTDAVTTQQPRWLNVFVPSDGWQRNLPEKHMIISVKVAFRLTPAWKKAACSFIQTKQAKWCRGAPMWLQEDKLNATVMSFQNIT